MKHPMLVSTAAVAAIAGATLIGTPANAAGAAEQCDSAQFQTKVELVDAGPTVDTGLQAGTAVCIKAGTHIVVVTVDDEGWINQNVLKNKPGNAFLGISYYAYGEQNSA